MRAQYRELSVEFEAEPFFKDLPHRLGNAHLVISRSGASTVAELAVIGRPSILEAAGMRSPYPLIWSLPMRVEDPSLRELTPVLRNRRAQWVLVDPVAMQSWGMTGLRAERVLARNYRPAFRSGDIVVWRAVRASTPWHPPTV